MGILVLNVKGSTKYQMTVSVVSAQAIILFSMILGNASNVISTVVSAALMILINVKSARYRTCCLMELSAPAKREW